MTLSELDRLGGFLSNGRSFGKLRESRQQACDNHALRFASAHGFGELEDAATRSARKPVERLSDQILHAGGEDVGVEKLSSLRSQKDSLATTD